MSNPRITQIALRPEVKNDFLLMQPTALTFESDRNGFLIYKIKEYQLATVEEGLTISTRHYELGNRGDYLIMDPQTGFLKIYTEDEYKKL